MTDIEHSRDAGVVLENAESPRQTLTVDPRKREELSNQTEHSRDAGVLFGATKIRQLTKDPASAGRESGSGSPPTDHRRDAGVIFETAESCQPTKAPDPPEPGVYSSPMEHRRDAGIIFESPESRPQALSLALWEPGVHPTQGERSRDAGILFNNTKCRQRSDSQVLRADGGLWRMLQSMLGFGEATARFTLNQMQNAVFMITDPGRALHRIQHSIDNLSSAMNARVEDTMSPDGNPKT